MCVNCEVWNSLSHVRLFVTPMDYMVHGILQARILEWVASPFSRGSSQPRDWTQVSHIAGGFFSSWAIREALIQLVIDRETKKTLQIYCSSTSSSLQPHKLRVNHLNGLTSLHIKTNSLHRLKRLGVAWPHALLSTLSSSQSPHQSH